jgi:RNA polymerase sigma-70 factor, ECF subfamily
VVDPASLCPDGPAGVRSRASGGDGRLAVRASRGDVEAFGQLVREHSDLVHRVTRRILGWEEAQDASQEVWIRAWTNIKGFRGESAFGTWLHSIAVNTYLSIWQKETRRRQREVYGEMPPIPELPGRDGDPESAALGAERREEIRVALRDVREEHRAALVLRHVGDLSYAEIAEVLGVPNGTAKGWASRGRAEMRVALARERDPGSRCGAPLAAVGREDP